MFLMSKQLKKWLILMNINTQKYIEKFVKIRDKSGQIIDFKLNEPQKKLYNIIKQLKSEGKPVRIIILKARQMGFSTVTESILFKETATKFNINTGIVAHKEEATTNLFNMSKRIYDNLPDGMKPSKKNSNAKELVFDNQEGTGLKSKIKCMTAGADGIGRSDTFNNLHISELAFWNNAKETMLGLMQSVPNLPNTMVIIESTANGYEYFKELWDKSVAGENAFVPLFVGWHELEEYQMPYSGFELTEEEKQLKETYNLTLEQLTWRRWCIANNCGGDVEQFKQEYPINPHEAFMLSGTTVFDTEKIISRLENVPKPLKQGYFTYDYDGLNITNVKWTNDSKGFIKIYQVPNSPTITKYCIGGDTSGEGSDYFTAYVLDAKTGNLVASMRHQFDADMYAKQIYCLGKYYEDALVGIESNFDSYPIMELSRLGYKKQYVREHLDTFTGKMAKSFGFRTTSLTRPTIISRLIEIVREHIELINDEDVLKELLTIVRNEKGRIEAPEGGHDDQMMGLAIAYQIKEQVTFNDKSIVTPSAFNFENERPRAKDYGETIKVI